MAVGVDAVGLGPVGATEEEAAEQLVRVFGDSVTFNRTTARSMELHQTLDSNMELHQTLAANMDFE